MRLAICLTREGPKKSMRRLECPPPASNLQKIILSICSDVNLVKGFENAVS